ncbi:hypothetical protein N24_1183 [Corynebacterium suranareeae]|uniref:Uncharacterized protein n=1 Tax=Corynebacterium suranareeae TaxID=2506452 RepID=A0A160PPU9_9CORY|nr:hypothetical protein N24_1183 [Corynebacterium suranareeae]
MKAVPATLAAILAHSALTVAVASTPCTKAPSVKEPSTKTQ